MTKILSPLLFTVITLISCSSTRSKDSMYRTVKNGLRSVSLETSEGTVIYTFSKSEVDTFDEIIKSSINADLNPVAAPLWKNLLRLTYADGKTEDYLIYDQCIVQQKEISPEKYMFTENVFWLYDKASTILGDVTKEHQRFPKGQ